MSEIPKTSKETVAQVRAANALIGNILQQNNQLRTALENASADFDRLAKLFGPQAKMSDYHNGGWNDTVVSVAIGRMKDQIAKALA